MSILKKATKTSATNVAVQGVGLAVGYKTGEGLAAVMPESVGSYKNWIVAALGLGFAMYVDPKTTSGLGVQAAALGIGTSGLVNGVSEILVPAVDAKTGGTTTDKFLNAFIGHKEVSEVPKKDLKPLFNDDGTPKLNADGSQMLGSPYMAWEAAEPVGNIWERPEPKTINIAVA